VPGRRRRVLQDRHHDRFRVLVAVAERRVALKRVKERHAQRPDVGGRANLSVGREPLGRQVLQRPQDGHPGQRRVAGAARDAEIDEEYATVRCHQDVAGLDIAVHDAFLVHGDEAVEHAQADPRDQPLAQLPLADHLVERLALDVLHDDPGVALDEEKVMDGHDRGMPDLGERPGLVQHAATPSREVGGFLAGGDELLKRDLALKPRVLGQPDAAHAAVAELADQPVPLRRRGLLGHRSSSL